MRRFGLRDDQWDRIAAILPGREGSVGVTAKDNRLFVEAVLYRYRFTRTKSDSCLPTGTSFSPFVSNQYFFQF